METSKETLDKIQSVLSSIRPYLTADGGDIEFVELTENNVVKVNLTGTCKTCSIRRQTLMGVEHALKSVIPEINSVVDI